MAEMAVEMSDGRKLTRTRPWEFPGLAMSTIWVHPGASCSETVYSVLYSNSKIVYLDNSTKQVQMTQRERKKTQALNKHAIYYDPFIALGSMDTCNVIA
jgi:hypothetical protein